MWGNKNKVFRNWSERDLGPELKKQFSNQIESCGIYNPHFSPKKISTDQTVFFFFFLSTVQIHPAVSHWSSFLLAPTLCPAVQTNIYRKGLFFKADTAGCLQNGLFSAYFSKLKIMCYIAISLVATGLHFLPVRALGHDWWLRCKQTCKRHFLENCFKGADLAERWVSSLPYLLPNCSLDFSCDGWNSCSCIGQSCYFGDGYHPSSGWPTSSFVPVGEKNQVYLAKVMVVLVFCNAHPN